MSLETPFEQSKSYSDEVDMLFSAIKNAGLTNPDKVVEEQIDREQEITRLAGELFAESHPEHEVSAIINAYYDKERADIKD